jgi:hypothetical protein
VAVLTVADKVVRADLVVVLVPVVLAASAVVHQVVPVVRAVALAEDVVN